MSTTSEKRTRTIEDSADGYRDKKGCETGAGRGCSLTQNSLHKQRQVENDGIHDHTQGHREQPAGSFYMWLCWPSSAYRARLETVSYNSSCTKPIS